jgi:hypothetical protein
MKFAENTITNLGLQANSPILLPDFNQIWMLSTDFRESPKYQISWKFVQWEPRWYVQTDGQTNEQAGMTTLQCALSDDAYTPENRVVPDTTSQGQESLAASYEQVN